MFWRFIETVVSFKMYQSESSPQTLHAAAFKAATITIGNDPLKLKLLKFALGLRMYSPKIEMFNQVSKNSFTKSSLLHRSICLLSLSFCCYYIY